MNQTLPLSRWLQRSYLRAAVVPLVIIELGFLAVYWITGTISYQRNVEAVASVSRSYISDIATRESATVESTLGGVSQMTGMLARASRRALDTPFDPPAAERARYGRGPGGSFVTTRGRPGRDVAAFYSGVVPIGPQQVDKVWRSVALDPTFRDIAGSSALIQQVYVNTFDSYNRIYPYFNVLDTYAPGMRIPDYNFYYEADRAHNPARKPVWTDAYVDPAGSGWMVSSIAPVYRGNRLEAVVGIDVTVDTVIQHVLDIRLPWQGYALLIGRDGTILALPPAAENDLGLRELKGHHYAEAIRSDTFKPASFNVNRRRDLAPLAALIKAKTREVATLDLSGRKMIVASAPLKATGWTLAVMVPEAAVFQQANAMRSKFQMAGLTMAAVLLVFYLAFFALLIRRARAMSTRVAQPLEAVEAIMARIGMGEYRQTPLHSGIRELDRVSHSLVAMGGSLGEAHQQITAQEETIRQALANEQRISAGQRRFITVMSHELRTPLTIIDSSGQVLKRRAARLTEEAIVERADLIRDSAERIRMIMDGAVDFARNEEAEVAPVLAPVALADIVAGAAAAVPDDQRRIAIAAGLPDLVLEADGALLARALAAALDNALKYSGPGAAVEVAASRDGDRATITVRDSGEGIAPADLPSVGERFFRGGNSTAVPGAGVGLFLARKWLAVHGGTLTVASEPGVGTTVTLSLPCTRTVPEATARAAHAMPDDPPQEDRCEPA